MDQGEDQGQSEMTSNEEVSSEQQVVEEPPSTGEQTVSSELNDSTSGKEKDDEQQKGQDSEQTTSQVPAKEKEEEEPTAKPMDKPPKKLRCFDPTGTVDILMGTAGITGDKPTTISQFLKKTIESWPDVNALCWKDKKEEPWKSLTYAQYEKLIYNVAKSFIKVMYCKPAWYIMYCVVMV